MKWRTFVKRRNPAPLVVPSLLEFRDHFARLNTKPILRCAFRQECKDSDLKFRCLAVVHGERCALVLKPQFWMPFGIINDRGPNDRQCGTVTRNALAIGKAQLSSVQPGRGEDKREEDPIEIINPAAADKAEGAARRALEAPKECQHIAAGHDVFWTRLNLEKRAVDVKEISRARGRCEFREATRRKSERGVFQALPYTRVWH